VSDIFTYPCGLHTIVPGKCSRLTALRNMANPKCNKQVTCFRYRCGHSVTIPCYLKDDAQRAIPGNVIEKNVETSNQRILSQSTVHSELSYCEPENNLTKCTEFVSYRYSSCSHLLSDVLCYDAFNWAEDNDQAPLCKQIVEVANPICGHKTKIQCCQTELIRNWNPWENQTKPKITEYVIKYDENNEPIIGYSIEEQELNLKQAPIDISKETLICNSQISINKKCGHSLKTICSEAYWGRNIPCIEPMSIECSQVNCKHIRSITCDSYVAEKREKKTPRCKNILQKLCQKCNLNKVPTKCSQSTVNCNEKSTVVLKCGHEATWLCGSDDDPRDYPLLCQFCIFPKWKELIENEPSPDIELQLRKKLMNQIDTLLKDVEITEQEIFEPRDLEIHTESKKI